MPSSSPNIIPESQLWDHYRKNPNQESRQQLILRYEGVVRKVASYLYKRRIDDIASYEDYYQFGLVGMLESLDRYKADYGVNFKTYSGYRIRGAIVSGVAKMSEKRSRYDIWQTGVLQRKHNLFENIEQANFEQLIDYVVEYALSNLLELSAIDADIQTEQNLMPVEMKLLNEKIQYYVSSLPLKLKLVVQYHYYNELTFSEIADILGVNLSRVSQLHKQAMQQLNEKANSIKQKQQQFLPL